MAAPELLEYLANFRGPQARRDDTIDIPIAHARPKIHARDSPLWHVRSDKKRVHVYLQRDQLPRLGNKDLDRAIPLLHVDFALFMSTPTMMAIFWLYTP